MVKLNMNKLGDVNRGVGCTLSKGFSKWVSTFMLMYKEKQLKLLNIRQGAHKYMSETQVTKNQKSVQIRNWWYSKLNVKHLHYNFYLA